MVTEDGYAIEPAITVPQDMVDITVSKSGLVQVTTDGATEPTTVGQLELATFFNEAGLEAARLCAINVLAQVQAAVGDLDRGVVQCIRLGGFINAVPTFAGLAGIMNGASDLMVEILGDRGRHARSTVGVAELPLDAAVEVEALFEVR